MRFVIAIVLFVVAFVSIGLGIAQRTILAGPASFSTSVTTGSAPITVVDGAALNALQGTQTIALEGDGDIFLGYGRTADVLAWVDDLAYNHVTFDLGSPDLVTESVSGGGDSGVGETAIPTPPPTTATEAPTAPTTTETDAPVAEVVPFSGEIPDPHGSDLWVQEFDGNDELIRKINAPQGISLIIMSNGVDPAPATIGITWPIDNSAPLSGPLIIAGIIALLAGLAAFVWALVHARRRRGPRRKQPRLPRAPQPKRLKRAPKRKEITAGTTTMAVAGALTLTLALAGCTTGGGVLGSGLAPEPTPESTDIAEANDLKPPAVTEQQLNRIVAKLAGSVAEADAAKDATLAGTRLAGPALAARLANYTITTKDSSLAAISAFPDGEVGIMLAQQNDGWPRSVFATVQPADSTLAPVGVMLVQEAPRENYKVHYLVTLEPGLVFPPVAPKPIGAAQQPNDNAFGLLPPDQLAQAYGDILTLGEQATDYALFDVESDTLRVDIGFDAKQKQKSDLPATAKIEFTNGPNIEAPISFPTNDSGQIIAVALDDTETVTPVEAGAAINTKGTVKALSGMARSTKGIVATYGVQLLFYVPPVGGAGESQTIQLLGFSQSLVSAKEVG